MSAADTRSIGQVLYEKLRIGDVHATDWMRLLNAVERERYERTAEVIFKRGHDARGKEEKSLTPKAKQYRDALREAAGVLRFAGECVADRLPAIGDRILEAARKAEAVLK